MEIEVNGRRRDVTVRPDGRAWVVEIDGRELAVDMVRAGERWSMLIRVADPGPALAESVGAGLQTRPRPFASDAFRSYELAIEERSPGELVVYVEGQAIALSVPQLRRWGRGPERRRAVSGGGAARVVAPMPGRVVKVLVESGQAVEDRQPLVVVEAMKMENELRSPRAGIVTTVAVTEGMAVESGAVLIVVE